ncbi:MAG TPA: hypothetical protein VJ964_15120 [Balneolaceae bacterium]|nr:hypothetical protein [Balneolaceae bacterium]
MSLLKALFITVMLVIPFTGLAQTDVSRLKPEQYFDFWVGTWDLNWKTSDGNTETGTNHVEKILDGTVIQENFEATSGRMKGYKGKSVSIYQKRKQMWQQTWVDNQGSYIDLTGDVDGNKRIFITETTDSTGKKVLKRMVFYDITPDSFTWDWQGSTDNGKTWKLQWRIHYRRHDDSGM